MSNLAVYKLQVLEEFSKRMPKRLPWSENYTPCNDKTYNKAITDVRRVLRQMMRELE